MKIVISRDTPTKIELKLAHTEPVWDRGKTSY